MGHPAFQEITAALQASWNRDTAFDATEWSADNPARGNCVVSSLVVQDYLGGDLRRYHVTDDDGLQETHYVNQLPDGTVVDTTASQYQQPVTLTVVPIELKGYASARDKRLADEDTRRRYELLQGRVAAYLTGHTTG
jgi:hypothetical protein